MCRRPKFVYPSAVEYILRRPIFDYIIDHDLYIDDPSTRLRRRIAWLGGGSHALWCIFIVQAISLLRDALPLSKDRILDSAPSVCSALTK